jgi:hypothetical protein
VTAIKLDRRSCARGCRHAAAVACLVVGLCCTGCGKKQETSRPEPATADASSSRSKGAARSAARPPRPAAVVEKPAPAEPMAETVDEKPEVVVNESTIVAKKPAPAEERIETLEQIVDATVEEPVTVAEEPAPAAEQPARVVEEPVRVVEKPAPPIEKNDTPVAAGPEETPVVDAVETPAALELPSPPDHAALAEAAMRQGNCEKALEHFHYAREADPGDLELRLREAAAYRHCGWPDVTVELLSELDARSRALEPVAAEIAEAHRRLDQPGRAAMAWELRYIHHPKAWRAAAHAAEAWMDVPVSGRHEPVSRSATLQTDASIGPERCAGQGYTC